MLISRQIIGSMLGPEAADLDDTAFSDLVTSLGLEVEGIATFGAGLDTLVVGRVDAVAPHPQADKLRLVQLFDGTRTIPVVCGAQNVPDPGGLVVFAPVGTTLPGGLQIGARQIRGVGSEGMICSEVELEIGPDGDGIIVLRDDDGVTPGARLVDVVPGIVDSVLQLSVTPNRPDALGHVGVAADLAVKLQTTFDPQTPALVHAPAMPELVTLHAPDRCGRYIGRAYAGARVGPSPLWLRVRLHRLGLRPINNVVDITNLVLMEWGQPLHVFDRDNLDGGRVVVRRATAGEPMKTLDEQALELSTQDLVIADASKPQALAGVMGGIDSGVESGATRLLLEAAWFAPTFIRRTARAHGLSTDSSYRFERGVDHGAHLTGAAARAASLIERLAGARCIGGADVRGRLPDRPTITLRPARCAMLLGMDVDAAEATRILRGLEIEVDDGDPAAWTCRPPTHRPDLEREVDLVEEVMRHHGLEALPMEASPPSTVSLRITPDEVAHERARERDVGLVRALAEAGLHEHLGFVFSSAEALAPFEGETPVARAVEITNPMRVQTGLLRTHLLPDMLDALAVNVARHARAVRLFEYGRIYAWPASPPAVSGPTATVDARLPIERKRAAVLLSDGARPQVRTLDGRTAAGVLLRVLERVGVAARVQASSPRDRVPWLHPGIQAVIASTESGEVLGRFGQVHPDLTAAHQLPDDVEAHYGELFVEALPARHPARYVALPRFPATSRDLSLEIPVDLPAVDVVDALIEAQIEAQVEAEAEAAPGGEDPPRLASGHRGQAPIEIIEDYRGEAIPDGHRALLLRLNYRAAARSVTDAEVQALHEELVTRACEGLRPRAPSIRTR